MRKAILKVKLKNREDLINGVTGVSQKFKPAYWQHDRIFVPAGYSREKAMPRLSLRTIIKNPQEGAMYLLVMRRHFKNKKMDVVNVTEVKDYTEAAHILYQLGYEFKAEVSRRREELILGNSIRIFLDKIDGLNGHYAKIEADLLEGEEAVNALEDLEKTFGVLNIEKPQIIDRTYGELIESSEHDTVIG